MNAKKQSYTTKLNLQHSDLIQEVNTMLRQHLPQFSLQWIISKDSYQQFLPYL